MISHMIVSLTMIAHMHSSCDGEREWDSYGDSDKNSDGHKYTSSISRSCSSWLK